MRRRALIAASLAMAGLTGCTAAPRPKPKPVVINVFLRRDVTSAQRRAIEATLRASPAVAAITYQSSAEAYAKFKKEFKDSPKLLKGTRPEDLPASFQVRLADPGAARKTVTEAGKLPGVDEAQVQPTPSPSR